MSDPGVKHDVEHNNNDGKGGYRFNANTDEAAGTRWQHEHGNVAQKRSFAFRDNILGLPPSTSGYVAFVKETCPSSPTAQNDEVTPPSPVPRRPTLFERARAAVTNIVPTFQVPNVTGQHLFWAVMFALLAHELSSHPPGSMAQGSTFTTSFIAFLAPAMLTPNHSRMQNLTEQLALNAMWHKAGRTNCTYFMDSGCSTTIINNVSVLHDIHNIPPVIIDGLTGSRTLTQGGTLQIELLDFNGDPYILVIPDVLYDPDAQGNLVSASQLTDLGFGIMLTKDPNTTALVLPAEQQNATWGLPLQRVNNVYFLCENDAHSPPPAPAYQAARFNRLTLEELMHLRFNHTPVEKLVKLNGQVRGLPRPLRHTKHTHLPCGTCSQAKSVKSPFQDASQNDDRDL